MTCALKSRIVQYMTYRNGILTIGLPKYDRQYECDRTTAYQLAYSKEPAKYYNAKIKNKLKPII